MNAGQSFRLAIKALTTSKMRSLLTMLGIIIGVGAVLILVSVVQGYNADLTAYYEKQGKLKIVEGQEEVADTSRLTLAAIEA